MNTTALVLGGVIASCLIYFVIRFIIMILGIIRVVRKGNKEAMFTRMQRQAELKKMTIEGLRELLRNDAYLNRLKGSKTLEEVFKNLEQNNEKEIIRNIDEETLYKALVGAEYEKGHKGRPEAVDNAPEIWDLIKELSTR